MHLLVVPELPTSPNVVRKPRAMQIRRVAVYYQQGNAVVSAPYLLLCALGVYLLYLGATDVMGMGELLAALEALAEALVLQVAMHLQL